MKVSDIKADKIFVHCRGFITEEQERLGYLEPKRFMKQQLAEQMIDWILTNPDNYEEKPIYTGVAENGKYIGREFQVNLVVMTEQEFFRIAKSMENSAMGASRTQSLIIGGISRG